MDHLVIAKRAGAKLGVVVQRDLLNTKGDGVVFEVEHVRPAAKMPVSAYIGLRMERARLKLAKLRDSLSPSQAPLDRLL